MFALRIALVCGLAVAATATAAKPGETVQEITALPGWPNNTALPSRMFSGYTYAGTPPNGEGDMYAHWLLVESESDPANDPLVIWYQGGPGASSLYGLLVEFGPLLLNQDSLDNDEYRRTGIPQLVRNPYSWNRKANLLVVDNPPPVGFGYCTPAGPAGLGTSCGDWNDELVAKANQIVLTRFVEQMPAYRQRSTFITGESYAGVYVPVIVRALLADPGNVSLSGFAVGDGCLGTEVLCGPVGGPFWNVEFMHGHGQFSNRLYRQITNTCTTEELKSGHISAACQPLLTQMTQEIGSYYSYNLYDTCYAQNIFDPLHSSRSYWSRVPPLASPSTVRFASASLVHHDTTATFSSLVCHTLAGGCRRFIPTKVPAAIHATLTPSFMPYLLANNASGDNGAGFNYSLSEPNLLPFYKELIENKKLRMLVYNGDTGLWTAGLNSQHTTDRHSSGRRRKWLQTTWPRHGAMPCFNRYAMCIDPSINSFMTQDRYTEYFDAQGLGLTETWRPWTIDGKQNMGGYVFRYGDNWQFATIRGSGHMVCHHHVPICSLSEMHADLALSYGCG
ncbi:uncharacterized protein MONBRDRAFT_11261 [Monosiga brevicollis MX1]|uniref:Carboxypeptidase n=1 Tax=Monosiga brevicollis TaxID=81824 RepID=A9V8P5_MONBE|nr:uncharacterized protein MONBRDRAFT_11261 [Monosiga brevicollis MX1]EDQ86178.1 predicted protein [Monosiga brevicollis MX1]|eukprot:XP_001749103.1 hypothetical protein [Monosiga brevicollis MX1]